MKLPVLKCTFRSIFSQQICYCGFCPCRSSFIPGFCLCPSVLPCLALSYVPTPLSSEGNGSRSRLLAPGSKCEAKRSTEGVRWRRSNVHFGPSFRSRSATGGDVGRWLGSRGSQEHQKPPERRESQDRRKHQGSTRGRGRCRRRRSETAATTHRDTTGKSRN